MSLIRLSAIVTSGYTDRQTNTLRFCPITFESPSHQGARGLRPRAPCCSGNYIRHDPRATSLLFMQSMAVSMAKLLVCLGCGDDIEHRKGDRRSLNSSSAGPVRILWLAFMGNQPNRHQAMSAEEALESGGLMCRKCFAAYERHNNLSKALQTSLSAAIKAIAGLSSDVDGSSSRDGASSGPSFAVSRAPPSPPTLPLQAPPSASVRLPHTVVPTPTATPASTSLEPTLLSLSLPAPPLQNRGLGQKRPLLPRRSSKRKLVQSISKSPSMTVSLKQHKV